MIAPIEKAMISATDKMSQSQIFLSVLLIGALSGGGGQLLLGNLIQDDGARQQIVTVAEAVERVEKQLIVARCEIRALRENFEWWTCYTSDGANQPQR